MVAGLCLGLALAGCQSDATPDFDSYRKLGERELVPSQNVENEGLAGLAVKDGVLLVGMRSGSILSFALGSDPVAALTGAPTSALTVVPGGHGIAAMALHGNRLYMVSNGILATVDVGNPRAPKLLGSLGPVLPAITMAASDKVVVLAAGMGQVQLIDVSSDPPVKYPQSGLAPGQVTGVALVGTRLYLTDSLTHTVRVYDVTQAAAPTLLGEFIAKSPAVGTSRAPNPGGLVVKGTTVYAFGINTLYIIDAADPAHMKAINANPGLGFYVGDVYYNRDTMQGAFVNGSVLAVPGSHDADAGAFVVHYFDVSNPASPVEYKGNGGGMFYGIPYLASSGGYTFSSNGASVVIGGGAP